jgi:hypothetical protein
MPMTKLHPDESDGIRRVTEWRLREAEFMQRLRDVPEENDEEYRRIDREFTDYMKSLWAQPVLGFPDVLLRALIAKQWRPPLGVDDRPYPYWVIDSKADGYADLDELAFAYLTAAVLELAKREQWPCI